MGLWTYCEIYQVDNVVFDDLAQMNTDLENLGYGSFSELYGDECIPDPNWQGVLRFNGSELEIANRSEDDFEGYGNQTSIWGCQDKSNWKTISDHMTSGKLVFFINCEEPSYNEYIVMEPRTFQVLNAKAFAPKF